MSDTTTKWLEMAKARLSRRVALWVFASVIAVEAVILVPSLYHRRAELLLQVRQTALAQAALAVAMNGPRAPDRSLPDALDLLSAQPNIKGVAVFTAAGALVKRFGEAPPALAAVFSGNPIVSGPGGLTVDAVLDTGPRMDGHIVVLRCDAAAVNDQLWAYALRIAGLVVIISLVVTVGTLAALHPLVIRPVLRLRADLLNAGESVGRGAQCPAFHSSGNRQDELGEVAGAFHQMYRQIVEAIGQRQAAQASLEQSLAQVSAFSHALNKELEQGRRIQANFLPQHLPQVPGWDFAASFRPARQVAGDFYDVFPLPDGKVGLVIADVCDKGVGAALFMALIRSLIRIFCGQAFEKLDHSVVGRIVEPVCPLSEEGAWPASCRTLEAVRLTNAYILGNHGELGMFATVFFGVLDPATGTLDYVNAGHEPPLILNNGRVRARLGPSGPAAGLLEEARFTVRRVLFVPGDIFLGYTDGLSEARSPGDELFGRSRLQEVVTARGFAQAADLLVHINETLSHFTQDAPQEDDTTLLAVRRAGGQSEAGDNAG